ncbi:hypothetical protein SAMN05661080_01918 [Modestobacter sp. DSM 44400]|nr:hypothetical protein SAMN05661080_01918 [Modestobacter sp. DSM 44400]
MTGVHADPERHAAWAAAWILRQLRRPVVREDWLHGEGAVASTWRLIYTGRVLGRTGRSGRRLVRRTPDKVTPVR